MAGAASQSYGSVGQWLTAYERAAAAAEDSARQASKVAAKSAGKAVGKARRLSFKEQQEWDGMEAAVVAAEEAVAARQAEVEGASTQGHQVLAYACRALEDAQHAVERLYARWQELEAKRGG